MDASGSVLIPVIREVLTARLIPIRIQFSADRTRAEADGAQAPVRVLAEEPTHHYEPHERPLRTAVSAQ